MVLEFHELEYHGKLEFPKLKFPINGRFLHISKIVINCKIFSKTVVFGHFGQYQEVKCPPPWDVA